SAASVRLPHVKRLRFPWVSFLSLRRYASEALRHADDDGLDLSVALTFDGVAEGGDQAPDRAGLLGQPVAFGAPTRLPLGVGRDHLLHLPGSPGRWAVT